MRGERGRGREPLASWGDSSAGGWHVTAVTVLKGGWDGDLLRPLIQLRHTAPCQTQQLDSSHSEDGIDLLSGGPVALPHDPAPLNFPTTPPSNPHLHPPSEPLSCSPANHPLKWLVKSGYGIQVRRDRGGQWGCVLNTPLAGAGEFVTSCKRRRRRWCVCPARSSALCLQYFTNGLRGCCLACMEAFDLRWWKGHCN